MVLTGIFWGIFKLHDDGDDDDFIMEKNIQMKKEIPGL